MRYYTKFKLMLLCVIAFIAYTTHAAEYSINTVPMPHTMDSRLYVSNPDGILSHETVSRINQMLASLEDSTTVETAVIVVERFDEDCWDVATGLHNKYGVGRKDVNNGLVITLATQDRCVAFSTGDGLEGVMPDAICNRIQANHMNGLLAEGRWDEGILSGVSVVCDYLMANGDESIIGEDSWGYASSEDLGWWEFLQFVLVFCLIGPVTWGVYMIIVAPLTLYRIIKGRKCPNCGESAVKLLPRKKGSTKQRMCRCEECGMVTTRKEYYIPLVVWSSNLYQFIFSALASSRGGGGGRSGGYGGGHASGGGSRSRF